MEFEADNVMLVDEVIIPPIRKTTSLEISPENTEVCDIARNQLDNLSKIDRKPRKKLGLPVPPSTSDTDMMTIQDAVLAKTDLVHDPSLHMHNLSSAIVSKKELDAEIRKKVACQDPVEATVGAIEIPHEMISSRLSTTPTQKIGEDAALLHDQELIDILEGKSGDETETFKVVHEEGRMVLVKDNDNQESTSYEIVTDASEVDETKAKILEREIAMRQIASLPIRKNKKSSSSKSSVSPAKTIVQSLAEEWTDDEKGDEMILEVVNMEESHNEPKIKILNMTILNDAPEAKPKTIVRPSSELPMKAEPKILNLEAPKVAPKILNINASAGEPAASFKRSRVIKKKEIWDPSASAVLVEKKLPVSLPPSITIKKLTKESISKVQIPVVSVAEPETTTTVVTPAPKPIVKRFKKRSEIDKLLQDEGAVNMIYSLERENNNKDVADIAVKEKSQESSLVTKTKAIKNVVMKQSSSPPEAKPAGRARAKRDVTPVKTELDVPSVAATKVQKATVAGRKKKADNSWDYIYSQAQATCDDAMIIRRRSNSSYSSSAASPRRLSVDVNESFESPPPSAKKMKRDSKEAFEFTKPPLKNSKSPADKLLTKDFVDELRGKISTVITKNKEKPPALVGKGRKRAATLAENSSTPAKRASERRANGSDHKEYRLVKEGKLAHIIINQTPLSISLLSEMKSVLNQLESDDCQVVLITSSEGFSMGLEYSTLVQTTVDKRKQAASDLVTAFKNFLISLAAFPKLLVCGVKGLSSGISVSMLPLFDLVFAEPTATFSLPHAAIGANPEGISILKFSGKVNVNAVNQMFYLNDTLDAKAAQTNGLITKIVAEDFDKELLSVCSRIASFSSQALESTKSILNEDFLGSIDAHLAKEVKVLQQQWITVECQEKFKKYAVKGECSPLELNEPGTTEFANQNN